MTCTCSRTHWSAKELLGLADVLATILMSHESITGVAVTGSVARMQSGVHDLDLVVLHDGSLPTGGFRQKDGDDPKSSRDIPAEHIGSKLVHRLEIARGRVPVTYLLATETTLWNCGDLQDLGEKEVHPAFWRTVFCQIPLLLLEHRGERLTQYTQDLERELLEDYAVVPIKHRCGSLDCRPIETWPETHRKIVERKATREKGVLAGVGSWDWDDDS